MLRVVLPVTSLASVHVIAVEVIVLIEIIVVVNVDVAVVPIAVAPMTTPGTPCGGTKCDSRAPHQSGAWIVAGISVGVVRIFGRRCTVNDSRVVRRDVNYVGIGLLNLDHLPARSGCTTADCLGLHNLL
jgi:hypothetical protein